GDDETDSDKVSFGVVSQVVEQRVVYGEPATPQKQNVIITLLPAHRFGTNARISARTVFNNEGLPSDLSHFLAHRPRRDICNPTWGVGHDDPNRLCRPNVGSCNTTSAAEHEGKRQHRYQITHPPDPVFADSDRNSLIQHFSLPFLYMDWTIEDALSSLSELFSC